ncbi:MAG: hypothetical protein M0P12_05720, partial [Paludibacteraceae bacterium]|nr:hypothetical protein [Paludibacteraceae bacterium]
LICFHSAKIMLFMNFGEYSCRYTNPTYPLIPYYGDTKRMKEDLLPELKYKTFKEGIETL